MYSEMKYYIFFLFEFANCILDFLADFLFNWYIKCILIIIIFINMYPV